MTTSAANAASASTHHARGGTRTTGGLTITPDWFKSAVFYEVLVRSFRDSDGDGVGDFKGLTEKLDYLQWLGRRLPLGAAVLHLPPA